jgi:predicted metal-dependent hydrolase
LYLVNKKAAHELILERTSYFNRHYKAPIGKIAVRNQRSRWGSCSKNGNLNFNYKLIFLPPEMSDYIVVHEMCHLKEFNHGRSFWALVGETIPNYRELRKILRKMV